MNGLLFQEKENNMTNKNLGIHLLIKIFIPQLFQDNENILILMHEILMINIKLFK